MQISLIVGTAVSVIVIGTGMITAFAYRAGDIWADSRGATLSIDPRELTERAAGMPTQLIENPI